LASRISEQSEALLQEAAKHAAEFGRSEVDTEHLPLALADSDVVKTILGQFKIKVDDLKRQIESEAKRGQALRGRDRRVAAREGCAQPRLRGLQ
jgi:ATP-dependent Clp protease ATP-binding subunit ClpC